MLFPECEAHLVVLVVVRLTVGPVKPDHHHHDYVIMLVVICATVLTIQWLCSCDPIAIHQAGARCSDPLHLMVMVMVMVMVMLMVMVMVMVPILMTMMTITVARPPSQNAAYSPGGIASSRRDFSQ